MSGCDGVESVETWCASALLQVSAPLLLVLFFSKRCLFYRGFINTHCLSCSLGSFCSFSSLVNNCTR